MYNKIINPKNGKFVNLNSLEGIQILKNYIIQSGGSGPNKKKHIQQRAVIMSFLLLKIFFKDRGWTPSDSESALSSILSDQEKEEIVTSMTKNQTPQQLYNLQFLLPEQEQNVTVTTPTPYSTKKSSKFFVISLADKKKLTNDRLHTVNVNTGETKQVIMTDEQAKIFPADLESIAVAPPNMLGENVLIAFGSSSVRSDIGFVVFSINEHNVLQEIEKLHVFAPIKGKLTGEQTAQTLNVEAMTLYEGTILFTNRANIAQAPKWEIDQGKVYPNKIKGLGGIIYATAPLNEPTSPLLKGTFNSKISEELRSHGRSKPIIKFNNYKDILNSLGDDIRIAELKILIHNDRVIPIVLLAKEADNGGFSKIYEVKPLSESEQWSNVKTFLKDKLPDNPYNANLVEIIGPKTPGKTESMSVKKIDEKGNFEIVVGTDMEVEGKSETFSKSILKLSDNEQEQGTLIPWKNVGDVPNGMDSSGSATLF